MNKEKLAATARAIVSSGKGILAADESTPTMGKRLALIGQENTEANRRDFRQALFETDGMEMFISGVILFEETLEQKTEEGTRLSEILESIDVVTGVDAIYATQLRATQETAEPVSKSLSLPINVIDVTNVKGLIKTVMDKHKGKIVLIVTHPDALPKLVVELQGSKKIEPITLAGNNKIFIVSVPWFGKVKTLQLKYGV